MYRVSSNNIAGVILIDSSIIKMKISQVYRNKISDLETLEYPISIGHEVFSTGKISFDSVREISSILSGYLKLIEEYKIINYKVFCTSAIGGAENIDFVIDQLKVKNGVNVETLEQGYEENIIYSSVAEKIKSEFKDENSQAVIANISTGYLGLSLYQDSVIKFSHNIPIGYMKFYDMFSSIIDGENDVRVVLEEYMSVLTRGIEHWLSKDSVSKIYVTGNDISLISEALNVSCDDNRYKVNFEELKKINDEFNSANIERISLKYSMKTEKIKLICGIISICLGVLKVINANQIEFVKTELLDCMMFSSLRKKEASLLEDNSKRITIESAVSISNYYRCNKVHSNFVCESATAIFDRLKKMHGLSQRKRLLLQVACIMHECGSCINLKTPNESVFNTIKSANIYGLSEEENIIVACIAGCSDNLLLKYENEAHKKLSVKSKLVVSKLTAIFLIANALDISSKQKLCPIKVKISQGEVVVIGKTDKNTLFEQWEFKRCSSFFKDVFGMKIKLLIKPKNLSI